MIKETVKYITIIFLVSPMARLELLTEPTCVSVFVRRSGPADDRDKPPSMFTQACQTVCSSEANGWFLLFQVELQTVAEVRQRRLLRPLLLPVLPPRSQWSFKLSIRL